MEINVIEDKKGRLVFELHGEGHGFCNALKSALWQQKGVKVAGYNVDHPLTGVPTFVVEADNPRAALKAAAEQLKKDLDELAKEVKKL
ncbi:DNA-directed RNA polymerase subunit L [Candidatus Woesearchaeota archaeon]|nr:MAG: DNA-directed RNA polymerase subunit L [Candidatus Woesearchaeota archaeon]